MKMQVKAVFVALFVVFGVNSFASSITNFTKSVYYVPPTNFHAHDFSKDDFTDLFAYHGSGIQYETYGDENILFMLQPACYFNSSDGKICSPLMPRTPAELANDFDRYYHGLVMSMTNLPDAKVCKMAGFTAVSASCQFSDPILATNYFYAGWIQIKSNIVVTVTITSSNKKSFDAATNSLRTLKINKKEILNIVKP
jgi:hypothetical protein